MVQTQSTYYDIFVDEPLIIEPNPTAPVLTYNDVRERTREYAAEHMGPSHSKKRLNRLVRRKFFETVISVGLIVLIGVLIILILYPQTELSEIARDNSNLKDSIAASQRSVAVMEENVNGVEDMDIVRAKALAQGMCDPNQNQVVNLPVPNTDTLKTNRDYNSADVQDSVFSDAQQDLADYYIAHPGT